MKNKLLSVSSLIAIIQLLFIGQLLFGLIILPALMTNFDSSIFHQIADETVRDHVFGYHKGNVNFASHAFIYSGAIGFILSSAASYLHRKHA